ncbi:MAG: F0F1 ATP synthase subunit A, partial [Bacteroidota bacterium]
MRKLLLITLLLTSFSTINLYSKEGEEHEEFDAQATILHHVLDTHDWHITDIPTSDGYYPIALHLPWFFYDADKGFQFAADSEALIEKGYFGHHEHVYRLKDGVVPPIDKHGHLDIHDKAEVEKWEADNLDKDAKLYDFSITKASLQMLLIALFIIFLFRAVAKGYQKNKGKAPSGVQSFFEPIIIFVRDDIAKEYLGEKARAFVPYLLSLFFFIWFANLLGLTPLNSNIMGNISVTAALALLTFIIVNVNGNKDYWKHIFNTPGVPWALKFGVPLMPIVEIIGVFVKPFALMMRLFANITAGHLMVLSLISMIFILGRNGAEPVIGGAVAPISI